MCSAINDLLEPLCTDYISINWAQWNASLVRLVPIFWKDAPLVAWTVYSQKDADEVYNNPHFIGLIFEGFIPERPTEKKMN